MAGTDFTTLGIGVKSDEVKVAEENLKDMAAAAKLAEKQASDFEKEMTRAIAKGSAFGITIAEAAVKVLDLAGKFLNLGLSISKYQDLAEQTGSDPAGLAALQSTADVAGVSIENIAMSMTRLSSKLLTAKEESGITAKAVKRLGLSFDELRKQTPEEQYKAVAVAMEGVASGADRVAIAQALFGRGGALQLRVMHELATEAARSNLLTNEQIRLADQASDGMRRTGSQVRQLAQAFMSNANPAIDVVAKALQSFIKDLLGVENSATRLKANTGMRDFALSAFESLSYLADGISVVFKAMTTIPALIEYGFEKLSIQDERNRLRKKESERGVGGSTDKQKAQLKQELADLDKAEKKIEDQFGGRLHTVWGKQASEMGASLRAFAAKAKADAAWVDASRAQNDWQRPGVTSRGGFGEDDQAKVVVSAYDEVVNAIERKAKAQREELALGRELTTFEKMKLELESQMVAANERARKAQRPQIGETDPNEVLALHHKIRLAAEVADANKAREAGEKEAQRLSELTYKANEKAANAMRSEAEANRDAAMRIDEHTAAIGKTKDQVEALAAARYRDEAAVLAQTLATKDMALPLEHGTSAMLEQVAALKARANALDRASIAARQQAEIEKELSTSSGEDKKTSQVWWLIKAFSKSREEIERYEIAQKRATAADKLAEAERIDGGRTATEYSAALRSAAASVLALAEAEETLYDMRDKEKSDPMSGAKRALNDYSRDAAEVSRSVEGVTAKVAVGIENNLVDAILHGKDAWGSLIEYMLQEALRLMVIKPMLADIFDRAQGKQSSGSNQWLSLIISAFGGGDGADSYTSGVAAITGTGHAAKGAAFDEGQWLKFAKGGIVDEPTTFKFASGGSVQGGLMGEAGPEGILPLERGPGGKLGVHASGGGGSTTVTVNHYNNFGSGVSPSQFAQGLAQNREQTKAEISDQIRRGSRAYSR